MKKILSILFIAFTLTSGAQNIWRAPSVFEQPVNFKAAISQTDGTDSLEIATVGTNSTLNHGAGTLVLNNTKAIIGIIDSGNYRLSAGTNNVQLQQGSTDSTIFTFSGDTGYVTATVSAWAFTPPLNSSSVTGFWKTTGNSGTNAATNFIGTTDNVDFVIKANSTERMRFANNGDIFIQSPFGSSTCYFTSGDSLPGFPFSLPHIGFTTGNALTDYAGIVDIDDATVFGPGNQVQTVIGMRSNTSSERQLLILGRTKSYIIISDSTIADTIPNNQLLQRFNVTGVRITRNNNDEDTAVNMFDVDENMAIGSSYSGVATAPTNGLIVEGNVGIGTNSPTTNLHVNGSVRIVDGTQGTGKVLTSDANGVGTFAQLAASDYTGIPAYANNAAAFAVLGANKLYYTDVAGEYILKVTH